MSSTTPAQPLQIASPLASLLTVDVVLSLHQSDAWLIVQALDKLAELEDATGHAAEGLSESIADALLAAR
jgi:hypothetical protein